MKIDGGFGCAFDVRRGIATKALAPDQNDAYVVGTGGRKDGTRALTRISIRKGILPGVTETRVIDADGTANLRVHTKRTDAGFGILKITNRDAERSGNDAHVDIPLGQLATHQLFEPGTLPQGAIRQVSVDRTNDGTTIRVIGNFPGEHWTVKVDASGNIASKAEKGDDALMLDEHLTPGFRTPHDAFQTMVSAARAGNLRVFRQTLNADAFKNFASAKDMRGLMKDVVKSNLQLGSRLDADEAGINFQSEGDVHDDLYPDAKIDMLRTNQGWRIASIEGVDGYHKFDDGLSSPRISAETLMHAARDGNVRAFQKCLDEKWSSSDDALTNDDTARHLMETLVRGNFEIACHPDAIGVKKAGYDYTLGWQGWNHRGMAEFERRDDGWHLSALEL